MEAKRIFKNTLLFILLTIFLLLSVIIAVRYGSVDLKASDIFNVLRYKIFGIGDYELYGRGGLHDIVWLIRIPRVILAVAVGISLSVSGIVMQAIVKNPLADPYILGVSSGAYMGAVFAVLLGVGKFLGSNAIGMCAFLGAVGISILVLMIANIGGKSSSMRLVLAGLALSTVCSAISNFVIYISSNNDGIRTITFWLMGSLAAAKWENLVVVLPLALIVTIFFLTQSRILNLMLLGDEVSITLGKDLTKYRHAYLIIVALLVGFAVYCAGMIGFVGLVIPHVVRMLVGTNHYVLIPFSALLGSIFLIWCDLTCRTILKTGELPIGILVSLIGAPCFIFLLLKKNYGFGGGA